MKGGKGGGLEMEAGGIRDGMGVRAGVGEHALARVDAEDFEIGKACRGGVEEVTVTDAGDQQALATLEGVEMGNAGALEATAGEEAFHPGVVRCEDVEGHERGASGNVG